MLPLYYEYHNPVKILSGEAALDHLGTVATRAVYFGLRRVFRHDNRRMGAQFCRHIADGLGVVAAGGGRDASCQLFGCEAEHLVGDTAQLERAGVLQVFQL